MSVELDPVELGFKRPFNHEVSQVLRLFNPNSDPVAFKVKTTAPKQYCVRPNSGRIEPGKDVEVQVLLQAMKEDPPADAKCRDKFLVQSIAISADNEFSNIQQVWQHIETTAKSSIQEKKIRVLFLSEEGASSVNGLSRDDTSAFTNSPTPAPRTPQRVYENDQVPIGGPGGPSPVAAPRYEDSTRDVPAQQSGVGAAAASVASAIPTSSDELKAQLAEAKAQITRLTQQTQEQGLRQRKSDAVNQDSKERITTGTTGMGIQQSPASGVPVQVVAGLCLLCFLIAYFFF